MKPLTDKQEKQIYNIIVIFIILCGIALRILFFSYGRPLWNDECALAVNIINRLNYFSTLEYNQAAPALFMYASKFFYGIFTNKDLALRIIPLISSILSIFLFYALSVKILVKKISIYTALFLFVFCYPLCYYSQEFKPYSTDVFSFLVIVLSYFYTDKISSFNYKGKILCGIGYSLVIWLSFSSIFALASLFFTLLVSKPKILKSLCIPAGITFLNLIITVILNFHLQNDVSLHTYWANGFIDQGFIKFLSLNIENIKYIFNSGIPLFFLLIALFGIIQTKKENCAAIIVIPLLLTLLLSYFRIYPYSKRCILFLIPIFILLCTKILDYINFKVKFINFILTCIISVIMIYPVLVNDVYNIIYKNYIEENLLVPLALAQKEAQKEDTIYISDGSEIIYDYYKHFIKINSNIIVENTRYNNNNEYIEHLEELPKNRTYYWIIAHHPKKFERNATVYHWAKYKKNFKMYTDGKGNSLIRFSL